MISIIVPIYKVESYLRQCLDSILNQSYRDFELILIDDGSPDNCGAICDEYACADGRVRVVHQENSGVSAARNAGLAMVKGEYIVFVDADDVIHPLLLEHLYRAINTYAADIAMCWFSRFKHSPEYCLNQPYIEKRIMSGREACSYIGASEDRVSTTPCMKMCRIELFEGIQYPHGQIHEDEAVTHKLLYKAKKIVELDEQLYFYRITPNSIMTSPFSVKRYDAVTAYYERYQFYLDNNEPELAADIKKIADSQMAKYSIICRNMGIYSEVPKEYRISIPRALSIIRKLDTDEKYHYWLGKVHPNLARAYTYWKKIKAIFK